MNKYIQKIEKLIKQKMEEGIDKEPEQKGFMARKQNSKPKDINNNMNLMETVADAIVHIRKKRMEMK